MNSINLYKIDAAGNLRHWMCRFEYDLGSSPDHGRLRIFHGVADGAYQEKEVDVVTNQSGRSLLEQMHLEGEARANKKRDIGYCDSAEEAEKRKGLNAEALPRPMLAQKVRYDHIDWANAYAQRKYDGHRCIVTKRNGKLIAYSRNGKPIDSIWHILQNLKHIPEGLCLDGELYCHGVALQTISSWVRRAQTNSLNLVYVVYDMMSNFPFQMRLNTLRSLVLHAKSNFILAAPTWQVGSPERVIQDFKVACEDGYEGLIIRQGIKGYQAGKRAKQLMKVKDRISMEFPVHAIDRTADGWARLYCRTEAGKEFKASCPGDMEFRHYVADHPEEFIGRMVTVEFAYWTNEGKPGHGCGAAFRDDL